MRNFLLVLVFIMGTASQLLSDSRFVRDNFFGIVYDTYRGLMWSDQEKPSAHHWEDAINYCEDLKLAGYEDWHLPNYNELFSLIDLSKSPVVDEAFTNSLKGIYWSSTQYKHNYKWHWIVELDNSDSYYAYEDDSYQYTMCVRTER